MRTFFVLLLILSNTLSFSHSGSSGDPFTALGQARGVTAGGIYYFNLGGTTFNTYVDINGYVQIAIDFGGSVGDLPQGTSLSATSRGILSPVALASLTSISHVRITSSSGNLNVISSDATIISRVQNNISIHKGVVDNSINNSWTGTNSIYITTDASGCTNSISNLHQNVVHVCGNTSGFHWIPNGSKHREYFNAGEVPSTTSFRLWVRDANYSLPVNLLDFETHVKDNNLIELYWKTSSETNNDYFTIERSQDGKEWIAIEKINGAGNSVQVNSYHAIDKNPLSGASYYRIKQTDFNEVYSYSGINSVLLNPRIEILLYPNPASSSITVEGNATEITSVKIYNAWGDDVTDLIQALTKSGSKVELDLSNLTPGIYSIKTNNSFKKFYKQ